MGKILSYLASPILMGILAVILMAGCAFATFIENDFGTQTARLLVYNALWFEVVLALIALNLLASMLVRKLYQLESFSVFLFHAGFITIIIGAAVTRYTGLEGMIHIREGATVSGYQSSDSWIRAEYNNVEVLSKRVDLLPISKNHFSANARIEGKRIKFHLSEYIPNAIETLQENSNGTPVISLMMLTEKGNEPLYIPLGGSLRTNGNTIGFEAPYQSDVSFALIDSGLVARSLYTTSKREMAVDSLVFIPSGQWFDIKPKVFYRVGTLSFAFRGLHPNASIAMATNPDPTFSGRDYLNLDVCLDGHCQQAYIPRTEPHEQPHAVSLNGMQLTITYGPKLIPLPFSVKLNEFVMEKYPGSESPSSFTSYVEVLDSAGGRSMPYAIFMNNILRHRGTRLFQSSYDTDLKGTYLSVNKDPWGTGITYTGYFMLIIGMIWALIAPNTRFRKLLTRSSSAALLFLLLLTGGTSMANAPNQLPAEVSEHHAKEFGHLMVQDAGGRIKPLSTLASETLRKLNRSNIFMGQKPEQILLSITAFPEQWQNVPIIRVSNPQLQELLGIRGKYASFTDFFSTHSSHSYKLAGLAQSALSHRPSQRNALDKEILKVDERVNILYMILSGQLARLFPEPDHPESRWFSMAEASEMPDSSTLGRAAHLFAGYIAEVRNATRSNNWGNAHNYLMEIRTLQHQHGGNLIPSDGRVKAEVWLNSLIPFERLIPWYGLSGLTLLILAFISIVSKREWVNKPMAIIGAILLLATLFHTFGIALRWYISGRAPLSNSYETMVYVAWAAMLGGFIFVKRSRMVLPASALLSTLILFVAHLSWMDPQITNLVPVLKSYWLTIHVAVITASYGFFGMSAILGLLVILLLSIKTQANKSVIETQVREITTINELSLTLGLYLLTAGCFFGAVWANESWGRYWGWDPKETWTLITIVVYSFILHMRLIPGLRSVFSFNFAALIGVGSVIMTYFGVNYYLSGLHSYAGGDSPPIPSWILFVVLGVISMGGFAWYNEWKNNRAKGGVL